MLICPRNAMTDPQANSSERGLKIRATVVYEKKEKRLLTISLTNDGDDFDCPLARLPWRHWHSMTLLVVQKTGQPIPFQEYIDDPVPGNITLKRNQTIEGSVDLDARFPQLTEVLSSNGLDVFWSFELRTLNGNASNRVGGWTFMPVEGVKATDHGSVKKK